MESLLLVAGCWLLVAGCWLLVAGCWCVLRYSFCRFCFLFHCHTTSRLLIHVLLVCLKFPGHRPSILYPLLSTLYSLGYKGRCPGFYTNGIICNLIIWFLFRLDAACWTFLSIFRTERREKREERREKRGNKFIPLFPLCKKKGNSNFVLHLWTFNMPTLYEYSFEFTWFLKRITKPVINCNFIFDGFLINHCFQKHRWWKFIRSPLMKVH